MTTGPAPTEERVVEVIERQGPRTGAELSEVFDNTAFALWKMCALSERLTSRTVGRRYLRLDRRVEGYARLSPSMLREFFTYTVVGLTGDETAIEIRGDELRTHIEEVSNLKFHMASRLVEEIVAPVSLTGAEESRFCAVLAGDVVYGMAHDVRRPERSTGMMVRGSDLDIVILLSDEAPGRLAAELDDAIYRKKFLYLKNPAYREEIDYVIKRFDRLREQAAFDSFRKMVACKIFEESVLLYGSRELFDRGKTLLAQHGVSARLRELEREAVLGRQRRERFLLTADESDISSEDMYVFHTDHEAEEME